MVISTKIEEALNRQINAELYSAYLYLAMASYFESHTFKGFAHWNAKQFGEEQGHAMRIYKYIFDRGGRVSLDAIAAPQKEWKSPLDAFSMAYDHEQKVTGMIHSLVELARAEKDTATERFLDWFVNEQVEEEDHARTIVDKLTLAKENLGALFMIDAELGRRE
ncbi:MAG: ferritin [Spirochaetes bacterium]|nr:ferritin [Spirochaetota bacterium]